MDREELRKWAIPSLRVKDPMDLQKIERDLEASVPPEVIQYAKPAYLQILKFFSDLGENEFTEILRDLPTPRMQVPPSPVWGEISLPPQALEHPLSPFSFWSQVSGGMTRPRNPRAAPPVGRVPFGPGRQDLRGFPPLGSGDMMPRLEPSLEPGQNIQPAPAGLVKVCPVCGVAAPPGARFCELCGSEL
ncbi:MAG TPA: zinc ribbon domain-containing protein [Candidatus Lokiarchaeia archaeon]|nr:zinc ribbon domain-containing protein [Candidatus Lokiarchaeia archaeon]